MKYLTQISKSGWGVLVILAGVLSFILDFVAAGGGVRGADGESLPLFQFQPGSATIGWLRIVFVLIVPALIFRAARKRSIYKGLAFVWCSIAVFGWLCVRTLMGGDSPPQAGFTAISGVALCWRLMTWGEERFPETAAAPEQKKQEAALRVKNDLKTDGPSCEREREKHLKYVIIAILMAAVISYYY
jgi:hypothetical protein